MAWARRSAGGLYGGVYRDADGKVRYLPCEHTTKREARNAGAAAEERARRGYRHDPAGARMLWGAWCDEWLPTRGVEPSTAASGASYVRRCRNRWSSTPLGMISQHDIRAWTRKLERELAASSVRQAFYLLSASLQAAISHGLIDTNPCRGVKLPLPPVAAERYLTDLEVGQTFHHLDERFRLLAEVLLGTGMRLAELCGLHWQRVDLDALVIYVVEVYDVNTRSIKGYPKSRRIRRVPIEPEIADLLVAWRDQHPDTGSCGRRHIQDDSKRARARARVARGENTIDPPGSCRSSLVITGPRGAPIDPRNFTKREWTEAVKLAEIPHATPHALRHTYASRLLTSGVTMARVSQLLGHSSTTTTERYAHLIDDGTDDDVRAALAARRNPAPAKPNIDLSAAIEELRTIVDVLDESRLRDRLERLADRLDGDAAGDATPTVTDRREPSSWTRPRAV